MKQFLVFVLLIFIVNCDNSTAVSSSQASTLLGTWHDEKETVDKARFKLTFAQDNVFTTEIFFGDSKEVSVDYFVSRTITNELFLVAACGEDRSECSLTLYEVKGDRAYLPNFTNGANADKERAKQSLQRCNSLAQKDLIVSCLNQIFTLNSEMVLFVEQLLSNQASILAQEKNSLVLART